MKTLKNNLSSKLLSLFIALLLWSFVISEVNPPMTKEFRNVEVTLLNSDALQGENLIVVEPQGPTVTVEVSARRNVITSITESDIHASVDLAGKAEGAFNVPIQLSLPDGVKQEKLSTPNLSVKVEKYMQKEMTVDVRTLGRLPDVFIMEGIQATPAKITMEGARSAIEKVHSLQAQVDVSSLQEDATINVPLTAVAEDDTAVPGISLGQSFVNVAISLNMTKELPISLKTVNNSPADIKVSKRVVIPEAIRVKGDKSVLDGLKSISTEPVDLSEITGNVDETIKLELSSGVSLVNPSNEVRYMITTDKVEEKSITVPFDAIAFNNLGQGLTLTPKAGVTSVTLKLKGLYSVLSTVTQESLKLQGDMTGVVPGQHLVPLTATLPTGVEMLEDSAPAVEVVVSGS